MSFLMPRLQHSLWSCLWSSFDSKDLSSILASSFSIGLEFPIVLKLSLDLFPFASLLPYGFSVANSSSSRMASAWWKFNPVCSALWPKEEFISARCFDTTVTPAFCLTTWEKNSSSSICSLASYSLVFFFLYLLVLVLNDIFSGTINSGTSGLHVPLSRFSFLFRNLNSNFVIFAFLVSYSSSSLSFSALILFSYSSVKLPRLCPSSAK